MNENTFVHNYSVSISSNSNISAFRKCILLHRIRVGASCYCGLILILSLFGITTHYAIGQTLFGQNGSFTTPSADTYPTGNFALGSFFRSVYFQPSRFDATSIYLITGISPSTEVSFSFPGIWGNSKTPTNFDIPAQVGIKQRLLSLHENRYRIAVEGLMQRSPITEDTLYNQSANWGIGLIGSSVIGRNTVHVFASKIVSSTNSKDPNETTGIGLDRPISGKVVFNADLFASSANVINQPTTLTSLLGFRYQYNANLRFSAGGGVGITRNSYDWQYLLGISFSTAVSKVTLPVSENIPPPLPTERSVPEELPGSNISIGIPPPGAPELDAQLVVHSNSKSKPQQFIYTRLFFDENQFVLGKSEQNNLSTLYQELKHSGNEQCFTVVGHSDQIGSNLENFALGMARALYVAANIADSTSIPPENLLLSSAGKLRLSDQRDTENAWQMNRRVELTSSSQLSAKLDTIPEDSCTIQQFIQWGTGLELPQAEFEDLSKQLDKCILKLGKLQTDEIYVISLLCSQQLDYRIALHRLASFWLYEVQTKHLDPTRSFLRLQRTTDEQPNPKPTKLELNVSSEITGITDDTSYSTLQLQFRNLKHGEEQKVFVNVIADVNGKKILPNGDILLPNSLPNYRMGKLIKFNAMVQREFVFPNEITKNNDVRYTVYYFDATGKSLGSTPVTKQVISPLIAQRFAKALRITESKSNATGTLQIRVSKYQGFGSNQSK